MCAAGRICPAVTAFSVQAFIGFDTAEWLFPQERATLSDVSLSTYEPKTLCCAGDLPPFAWRTRRSGEDPAGNSPKNARKALETGKEMVPSWL
jgi:hypothetical protein